MSRMVRMARPSGEVKRIALRFEPLASCFQPGGTIFGGAAELGTAMASEKARPKAGTQSDRREIGAGPGFMLRQLGDSSIVPHSVVDRHRPSRLHGRFRPDRI